MFTTETTQGFTADEIATLNAALAQVQAENPEMDEKNIADRLNNAWFEGVTVEQLVEAAR